MVEGEAEAGHTWLATHWSDGDLGSAVRVADDELDVVAGEEVVLEKPVEESPRACGTRRHARLRRKKRVVTGQNFVLPHVYKKAGENREGVKAEAEGGGWR